MQIPSPFLQLSSADRRYSREQPINSPAPRIFALSFFALPGK
jgi:hypothetical protein